MTMSAHKVARADLTHEPKEKCLSKSIVPITATLSCELSDYGLAIVSSG